jgi:hypothetical protein
VLLKECDEIARFDQHLAVGCHALCCRPRACQPLEFEWEPEVGEDNVEAETGISWGKREVGRRQRLIRMADEIQPRANLMSDEKRIPRPIIMRRGHSARRKASHSDTGGGRANVWTSLKRHRRRRTHQGRRL